MVVLQEEEGDFGEVGRFADAVDADDGEDVGSARGVDGLDLAEEIERGGWSEHLSESFLHGGANGGFDGWYMLASARVKQ